MIPFTQYMRYTFTSASFLMAAAAFSWALIPSWRVACAGYVLGLFFSIVNGLITMVKTMRTADYALGLVKRRQGTGQLQRFLLAGMAGFAAVRYPETFNWIGVLIGLVTVTILSFVIAWGYRFLHKNSAERGEEN
jgi:ATP synthase protein I